jgi:putative transposase
VTTAGTIGLGSVTYMVDLQRAFEHVLVVRDGDTIIVTDLQGEVLAEQTRPGTPHQYVGNGQPRGPRPKNSNHHQCPQISQ